MFAVQSQVVKTASTFGLSQILASLLLVIALALAALSVNVIIKTHAAAAKLVEAVITSGTQRLLSQNILFLSEQLIRNSDSAAHEIALRAAASEMVDTNR